MHSNPPVAESGASGILPILLSRPSSPSPMYQPRASAVLDSAAMPAASGRSTSTSEAPCTHAHAPYEPRLSSSIPHHRPAFTHASTSFSGAHQVRMFPAHAPNAGSFSGASSSSSSSAASTSKLQLSNANPFQSSDSAPPSPAIVEVDPLDTSFGYGYGYSVGNASSAPFPYPSEKDVPPPGYESSWSHPANAAGSRRGSAHGRYAPHPHSNSHHHPSRRCSTDRRAVVALADTSAMGCVKAKLMGKEGGMGRALMLGWLATTVGFIVATAFWRGELFGALDRMSKYLYSMGMAGKGIFLLLILITTIPPLPLYSTLMVLAGYTFGVWEGFVVSYAASLIGAVLVFVVSRCWLRDVISKSLQSSPTAQTLLAIIPANPHLLLLIRIAPYPYNLLNVILASAPSLSLRTYTACTAISLLKLVLHTWIGAGIHDIASYGSGEGRGHGHRYGHHRHPHGQGGGLHPYPGEYHPDMPHGFPHGHPHAHGGHAWEAEHAHRAQVKMYATWAGIALCVGLFFYLTHLAKRALRKAQEEEEARRDGGVRLMGSDEEC